MSDINARYDARCIAYRDSKTGRFCKRINYANDYKALSLTYFPDDNCGKIDENYEHLKNGGGIGVICKNNIRQDLHTGQMSENEVNKTLLNHTITIKNFTMEISGTNKSNKRQIKCPFEELDIKVCKKDGACIIYLMKPFNSEFYTFIKNMFYK